MNIFLFNTDTKDMNKHVTTHSYAFDNLKKINMIKNGCNYYSVEVYLGTSVNYSLWICKLF